MYSEQDTCSYKNTQQSSAAAHPATDFADIFRSKVGKIRSETANAPSPVIIECHCERLSALDDVTADEIMRLVGKACSMQPPHGL